jgi:hypothetical protein
MLYRKNLTLFLSEIKHKYKYSVGTMDDFLTLRLVAHSLTAGL